MNQKISTGFAIAVIILIAGIFGLIFWIANKQDDTAASIIPLPYQKACTEEAKICPDGSAVGRTGDNCEFATCPKSEAGLIYKNDKFGFQLTLPKEWQNYKTEEIEGDTVYFELPTTDTAWKKDPWGIVFGITATPLSEVEKLKATSCSQKCISQEANAKIGESIKVTGDCENYSIPYCLTVSNAIGKNATYSFSYVNALHITDYPKDFTAELFKKADEAIKTFKIIDAQPTFVEK